MSPGCPSEVEAPQFHLLPSPVSLSSLHALMPDEDAFRLIVRSQYSRDSAARDALFHKVHAVFCSRMVLALSRRLPQRNSRGAGRAGARQCGISPSPLSEGTGLQSHAAPDIHHDAARQDSPRDRAGDCGLHRPGGGFLDLLDFSRAFKRWIGSTPKRLAPAAL